MEREWREASDLRSSLVSTGAVVACGAVLRFWHLGRASLSPVEADIVGPVLQLIHTGAYSPPALIRPTLPVYLQTAVAIVHFLWGATFGAWSSVSNFGADQIVGWGRAWSALLGTAVLLIVHQIGLRWGARHALLAAGLMAVTPLHVAASREIGDAAPLTFLAALSLLLTLRASERATRRAFAAAGAASGLAAACHYAGALTFVVPIMGVWMSRSDESSRLSRAAAAVAAAVLAFAAVTPIAISNLPAFLNGFAAAAASSAAIPGSENADVLGQLLGAFEWPGLLLAVGGLSLAIVRAITGPGHTRWSLLAVLPIVYFTAVAWHGATSDMIVLPMIPAAALLAAIAVVSGVSQLRRFEIPRAARTALIAALTVVAVLPPAVFSIELVRQQTRPGPVALPRAIGRAIR